MKKFVFFRMKKRSQLLIILFILVVICCSLFIGFKMKYADLFYSSTVINGVDVSGMNISEATEVLNEKLNGEDLIVKDASKEYTYSLKNDLGLTMDLEGSLKKIKEESDDLSFIDQIFEEKEFYLDSLQIDTDMMSEAVKKSEYYINGNKDKTTNAVETYNSDSEKFEIKEEYQGTNIVLDDFIENVQSLINKGVFSVDLTSGDYYQKPSVLSTDEALQKKVNDYNDFIGAKITYTMPSKKVVCDVSVYNEWLLYKDNTVSLDSSKIKEYVEGLSSKYDTYNKSRSFKTTNKGTITISGGSLGYLMNTSKEAESLEKNIMNKDVVTRKPEYSKEELSNNGVGGNYVEVDISGQHIYCYKNGSLVLQSACVTGNPNKGNATPKGTYRISYKQSPATLKGRIDPATGKREYETPVTYWMPFNGGVGFHDATWQPTFGGTRYLTNGSHGCVNLPYSVAQSLYSYVSAGTLVIVY